jgi:hypothetical protein
VAGETETGVRGGSLVHSNLLLSLVLPCTLSLLVLVLVPVIFLGP